MVNLLDILSYSVTPPFNKQFIFTSTLYSYRDLAITSSYFHITSLQMFLNLHLQLNYKAEVQCQAEH